MRTVQQFSITLPLDMAEAVEGEIKSGGYSSVCEVARDGVRALLERDAVADRRLREEGVAGYQAYLADPSQWFLNEIEMPTATFRRPRTTDATVMAQPLPSSSRKSTNGPVMMNLSEKKN